ncbi:MAG: peptide chain release factor N(5)-glutamine methyltransferase [Ginsengibacter sp.]
MTTGEVYIGFVNEIKTIYEEREAETISDWVFENVMGMKRWERRANQNKEIKDSEYLPLQKYLAELLQHRPVQYVLNEAWFYKMKFFVNDDVLIPRPETEELVEWIVNDFEESNLNSRKRLRILDIGSGSGCISIALKKELPKADIMSIDISEKALEVAQKNARELNASVDFLQIDFLDENKWNALFQYDIIVCNPPYIPLKEKANLGRNVIDFEPAVALFVEDDNSYIFYQKIAQFSKNHLNVTGRIYLEVHELQAEDIKGILENEDFTATIKKDIYGKNRMVKATKSAV